MAAAASVFTTGVGLITLLGYALDVRIVATVLPGSVPMVPNTAALFVLAGIGLWLVSPPAPGVARRRAGQVLGLLVALAAGAVLAQYVMGRSLGLDPLLFADRAREWAGQGLPGRFSPHTGVGFMVVGLTVMLLDSDAGHNHRYARLLAPAAAVLAGVGLTGRAFGLDYLYGSTHVTGMAIGTAVTFAVLSAGLLACRTDRPLAHLFAGQGLGGVTMRRLIPVVAAAILLAGVLFAATRNGTIPLAGFGVTVAVMILVVTLCVVFARTGRLLNEVDSDHRVLLATLRDEHAFNQAMLQSLPDGVIAMAPSGAVLQVSRRWCEITGFSEQDAVGRRPPFPWWPPEQMAHRTSEMAATLASTTAIEAQVRLRRPDGTVVEVVRATHPVLNAEGGIRMVVGTVRDLTERNMAEARQRRHAEQLTHYFQLSTDLMSIAGTDGYFKRLNPAWELTLGYTEAELTARPYRDFVHPDDLERTAEEMTAQTTAGKVSLSYENRYRCRDGSYRWLQWSAIQQGDRIYAVARDTTEQRQAADDQARLAAIVSGTDDAIISKTLDGTITSWNPAAERIYGYRAEDAIGKSIEIIFGSEHDGILERVGRGESVINHESTRLRADGATVHLGLTVSPIRDSHGRVVGAASIARDITARHKAEERFRRLLQAAPDAMTIADTDGTIVLVNEQAERLFGYPAAELIGKPVEMLMPHPERYAHLQHLSESPRDPSVRAMGTGMDLFGLHRDGTEFPIEVSLAPLDTDQGALVSASIRDVSDRKQIERDLAKARDEALAAAVVKSQFVAMVSHEIRTPMNGVIGLTALLMRTPLQPTQRRYAESIRASGRALLSIINDILDFSKIESGKITLVEADFALDRLIEDVVQVAAEASRDKDLEIQASYPPQLPTMVRGDEGRLRQVLLNLLGNAVKFTEHGNVVLTTDLAYDTQHAVTFTVTDTGIGIQQADLAGIFEPFSQVDAVDAREFGGTGLGLAICRQLVGLMGGRLDVTSEPGRGSRFRFTIPLVPQPVGGGGPVTPAGNGLSGRRVLIVDGNDARRRMMAEHAHAWGLAASSTVDGHTALAELRAAAHRAQPYEVAVLDQHLPDIDGPALARRIAVDPGIDTPILIMLTSGSYDDDQIAVAAGATALPKPVGPSQLYNGLLLLLAPEQTHHPIAEGRADAPDHGLVLLAEDNTVNQMVAVDTLEMLGYRVDVARNGAEAVELATVNTYQAVLMDCQMPKMDGFAATAELRGREGDARHTPIIAMTAGALAEDRDRCLAAGMDDYLSKPIDPDLLDAALERWITRHGRAESDGPTATPGTR